MHTRPVLLCCSGCHFLITPALQLGCAQRHCFENTGNRVRCVLGCCFLVALPGVTEPRLQTEARILGACLQLF